MRIDSHSGVRGRLYADLGKGMYCIPCVIWYDLEAKQFEAYRVGPLWKPFTLNAGRHVIRINGEKQKWGATAKELRFVEDAVMGRIALHEMAKRAEPVKVRQGTRLARPDPRRRCEGYACDRPVEWMTMEERTEPPAVVNGVKYDCASFVRCRYWCSWCYEPPQLVDARGDIVQVYDEIRARPS